MIVKLDNILFSGVNKFCKEWDITEKEWKDIIYHSNSLQYKPSEIYEYVKIIMKKEIPNYTLQRMLIRQELNNKAQILKDKGIKEVNIVYFDPHIKFLKQYYD